MDGTGWKTTGERGSGGGWVNKQSWPIRHCTAAGGNTVALKEAHEQATHCMGFGSRICGQPSDTRYLVYAS